MRQMLVSQVGPKPLRHFARQYRCGLRSDSLPGCCAQIVLGVESDSPSQRYKSEREEEAEDHVHSDENSVGSGHESAKEQLAPRHARTGGRVSDHIKRE